MGRREARGLGCVMVGIIAGLVVALAPAANAQPADEPSSGMWSVALPAGAAAKLNAPVFTKLHDAGLTTLFLPRSDWKGGVSRALLPLARRFGTQIVLTRPAPTTKRGTADLAKACKTHSANLEPCAVVA